MDENDYYEQSLIKENRNMQKELTKKKNAINVMTMHSSKGQEFKTVFVIGVSNNVIPYFKAKTLEEIEEERRLLYVAMTRAKDHLIITGLYKNRETKIEVSPFLQEIYDSSSINSSYSELSKNSSKAADTASNSSSLSIYSNTGSASTSVSSSK